MISRPISLALAVSAIAGVPFAAAEDFSGTVGTEADRWMYPFNATPGTRPGGSIFGTVSVPANPDFDNRDAQIVVAFDTTSIVPPGQGIDAYDVDSLVVRITLSGESSGPLDTTYDAWQTYLPEDAPGAVEDSDPGRPIEIHAAGFRFEFTRLTWQENTIFSATGPFGTNNRSVYAASFDRKGGLFDVSSNVNDGVDSNPLAIATFAGVAEGETPQEGAIANFEIDLSDPRTRDWVAESLDEGRIIFSISSLINASQGDFVLTQFYLRENPLVGVGLRDAASLSISGTQGGSGCEIPGDLNGDCFVDGADLGIFLSLWGTSNPAADLDGSGLVDGADLGIFLSLWGV